MIISYLNILTQERKNEKKQPTSIFENMFPHEKYEILESELL